VEGSGDGTGGELMGGRRTAVWAVAVACCVLSVAVIVVGTVRVHDLHSTPAASNKALVETGPSRDVARQVESAMTELWSYDYRTLDQSRAEAARVGTAAFSKQYASVYDSLDQLAPKQKAVVVAKVSQVAVQRLDGDRATAIVFLSQQATKATGAPSTATARLRVRMERVGGAWKVAAVDPF
jgi:Mce-associated membrane protein